MKILNKQLEIDPSSMVPYLKVTLRFDMELAQDQQALDPAFYEKFGKEFFEQISVQLY